MQGPSLVAKRKVQDLIIIGDFSIILCYLINDSLPFDMKLQAIIKRIYHMLGRFHSKLFIHVLWHNNKKMNVVENEEVHIENKS